MTFLAIEDGLGRAGTAALNLNRTRSIIAYGASGSRLKDS